MDLNSLKLFDKVIIQDDTYWNGRICIVDWMHDGLVGLSNCFSPEVQYIVGEWNNNNIKRVS